MKSHLLVTILTATSVALLAPRLAAESPPPSAASPAASPAAPAAEANDILQALQKIVGQVNQKISQGKTSEADMAGELKEFDDLLASHKDEKTDAVAEILVMKASLYAQVLGEPAKGADVIRQLKAEYPDTRPGKEADQLLALLHRQIDDAKIRASLSVGAKFPDFQKTDLSGKPLSISAYKGKVVLVDFWATWCGPCVDELPNVIAAYKKYHSRGFDIVGISLDQDKSKLTSFLKDHGMPWAQYFDGKGWNNELALKYGIDAIPSTFLLNDQGTIIARDLRGPALEQALARQLSKE